MKSNRKQFDNVQFELTPRGKRIISTYQDCRNAAAAIEQTAIFKLPDDILRQRIADFEEADRRMIEASNFTLN